MNRRRQRLEYQKGITVIEFTVVSVFFLFAILAIAEGARYIYSQGVMSHVARDGARYASVRGSQAATDPNRSDDAPATESSISDYIEQRSPVSDVTTEVVWSPDNSPGSEVSVTVTYTFGSSIGLFNDIQLTSTATSIVYF